MGGDDIDNALIHHMLRKIQEEHSFDAKKHVRYLAKLKNQAMLVKKELSQTFSATANEVLPGDIDFEYDISRTDFD